MTVKNLPSVDETVKLWDKHDQNPDPMGVGCGTGACLVAILAADAGLDIDIYYTVEKAYGLNPRQVNSIENGFMQMKHCLKNSEYGYGKAVAERVL